MAQSFPHLPPGHRPTVVPLQVEMRPDGWRVSTPLARGWAAMANTPQQLAHVIASAAVEVQIAGYAMARRVPYDLDQMTSQVAGDPLAGGRPARTRQRTTRRKSYAVEAWTKMEDGRWLSPSGRLYRSDSRAVQNVIRKRQEKGI